MQNDIKSYKDMLNRCRNAWRKQQDRVPWKVISMGQR